MKICCRQGKTELGGMERHAALHYYNTREHLMSSSSGVSEQGTGPIVGQDNKGWNVRRLRERRNRRSAFCIEGQARSH